MESDDRTMRIDAIGSRGLKVTSSAFPQKRCPKLGDVTILGNRVIPQPCRHALNRAVKRHRAEIRAFFGFRETSMEDGEAQHTSLARLFFGSKGLSKAASMSTERRS
jgi:hypothetical protein